jgi:hypothetical protein
VAGSANGIKAWYGHKYRNISIVSIKKMHKNMSEILLKKLDR